MLDKYDHFKKLSKTDDCSFYEAEDRTSMQNVLIKRLKQKSTWDQLLSNKNLKYLSKASFAPKMVEIFKKKGYYFISFDKPLGSPLSQPEQIGMVPLNKFYPLFLSLIEACTQLKDYCPQMYILPEWVFIHRNLCKVAHFEPFFSSDQQSTNKHVFMYNLQKAKNGEQQKAESESLNFSKQQSLIFNLGLIGYQLLVGKKATVAETEEEYLEQIQTLREQAEKRLKKITSDERLSETLAKMIKQDAFDCPTLEHVSNIINRKSKQYHSKGTQNPIVQLELQKIHLNSQVFERKKKFVRPCCKTFENEEVQMEVRKKGNITVAYPKKSYEKPKRSKSFLPQIQSNRHNFRTKETSLSKKTMLKSSGEFRVQGI